MFYIHPKKNFVSKFSANAFYLDQSKNLSSVKELTIYHTINSFYKPYSEEVQDKS